MNKKLSIVFVFLFCLSVLSCRKKGTPETIKPLTPDIYIAGGAGGYGFNSTAHYWKNGQVVPLPSTAENPNATGIFVSGSDVHVIGEAAQNREPLGLYWKNGVKQEFSKTRPPSQANDIVVVGKDVFIAGRVATNILGPIATYWKNGEAITYPDDMGGWAKGIFVTKGDVYMAGSNQQGNSIAKYWKNGIGVSLQNASPASMANAIAVAGNDVYVVGRGYQTARYWKNGVIYNLTNREEDSSEATDIAISGNDVYIVGQVFKWPNGKATIWKNGVAQDLPFGINASSVFVFNNDVYVAGEGLGDLFNIAMYWKNGIPHILSDGTEGMWANSIFVTYPK